jgi:hypothetical protein
LSTSDNLLVLLLKQCNQLFSLRRNQIDHMTAPVFPFLREPLPKLMFHLLSDPRVEPLNQIQGGVEARFLVRS